MLLPVGEQAIAHQFQGMVGLILHAHAAQQQEAFIVHDLGDVRLRSPAGPIAATGRAAPSA